MRVKISDEDYMNLLNKITTNILISMDKMNISKSDDKINDYAEYLSTRTDISKPRLKKILTLDVVKLLTLENIAMIAHAIGLETRDLFTEQGTND